MCSIIYKTCCAHTYKHGSSRSDLRPVALEELDDWDVVEVQHACKVLDLQTTKHEASDKKLFLSSWQYQNLILLKIVAVNVKILLHYIMSTQYDWCRSDSCLHISYNNLLKYCVSTLSTPIETTSTSCSSVTVLLPLTICEDTSINTELYTWQYIYKFVSDSVSHQVLGEVINEFSIVQALVIVEVVLKHGGDLLGSHHRCTHTHRILACLDTQKWNP